MIGRVVLLLTAAALGAPAVAAPKIESIVVKRGGKAQEVEIAVSVNRTKFDKGGCEARLDFGDGQGRSLDFGVATKRTVHHVYRKDGSYTIAVRGAGATPCDGAQQAALKVAGEPKKPAPRKKSTPKETK